MQYGKLDGAQSGAASIVFIMIVSLAIAASSASVIKSIKGSQEINTVSNAVTHSQNGMWLGAEAFRQYLNKISSAENVNDLDAVAELPIVLSNASHGTIRATDITVRDTDDLYDDALEVSTTIVNSHGASKTSSAIRAVYLFTPAPMSPAAANGDLFDMSFDAGVSLVGGLQLNEGGDRVNITVDGDIDVTGVSVNAIGDIKTTGTVTLGSQVEAQSVFANDDVELAGSSKAFSVKTLGSITTSGAAQVTHGFSNGNILITASKPSEILRSRKNVTVLGSSAHGYIDAGEDIEVTQSSVDTMKAVGDVTYSSWNSIGDIVSMSDVKCTSQWWKNFDNISANGSLHDCTTSPNSGSTIESMASNTVVPMDEIEPYEHVNLNFDVWTLRTTAHYFFEYDDAASRIMVTVTGVNGITNGTYYIGDYGPPHSNHKDYLCKEFYDSGKCQLPSEPLIPVCFGYSVNNSCISYDESSDTFTFTAVNTAPGIMFFDGNLHLQNGHGMSTFLASQSISTSGDFQTWAPNFGGFSKVCLGDSSHVPSGVSNRYTQAFSAKFPRNYCDTAGITYKAHPTGNIAMAAGGYHPSDPSTYVGGDISLGSASIVVGAVLAGNALNTGGQTVIHGVVAAGADADISTTSSFGGSTSIDFESNGEHYDPKDIPVLGSAFHLAVPEEATTVLLWARAI